MSFCKHPYPLLRTPPPTTLPPHNTFPLPSSTPQTLTSVHFPATHCSPSRRPRRHPLPIRSPPRRPRRHPLLTRSPPSPQLPRPTLGSDRGGSGVASRAALASAPGRPRPHVGSSALVRAPGPLRRMQIRHGGARRDGGLDWAVQFE
jgi:hypothetical protein